MKPALVVVMGVSGCGKSTVGLLLAQACGVPYVEGDDLHSQDNVERMRSGVPLTDAQRRGWLELLSQRLAQAHAQSSGLVVSCSALKRAYRDVLRTGAPELQFVHLQGERELLAQRTAQRVGHYMPASLLDSQLATLEPPQADERAMTCNVADSPDLVVRQIMTYLNTCAVPLAAPDLS
jgi:gluconokinase